MNSFSLLSNQHHTNWQTLGECKIPLDKSIDAKIQAWLKEVFSSLSLSADFSSRILISTQDSTNRAVQADTAMKFEHMHLRVFVSNDHISNEKTWGFFRIEKVGTPVANTQKYEHSIELYLYPEG